MKTNETKVNRFDLFVNRAGSQEWWATVFTDTPASAIYVAYENDCLSGSHYFSVHGPYDAFSRFSWGDQP